ncbi:MAG: FAD-binding oxidoreductase, partial [Rhodospirillaceae bacterium]|nr:FAD-binding oxidoreductase [Rhodospirillaceae bacterium]
MSGDYLDIHYARTRTPDAPRRRLEGHHKTQVCIIGGGLAGLTTALGLAERGVTDVILLEAERVGWGASGRNGGFVSPHYAAGTDNLIAKVGLDHTRDLIKLSRQAVDLVKERIGRYAIDCGPNPEGNLEASWFNDPDGLKRAIEFEAEEFGEHMDFIPRERLRDEYVASDMYFDGAMHHGCFWFHPLNYCLGIARKAEGVGVRIYEDSVALSLVSEDGSGTVTTDRGMVEADEIVVTTGAYDQTLVPELGGAFQPVATYIIVTEPVDEALISSTIKCHQAVADDRFSLDYYRRLEDNRILWGGRGSTRTTEPYNLRALMQGDMLKVYPELAEVGVDMAWGGLMSYAVHHMIQTGRLRQGLWYAQGFGGQGMAQTT